MSRPSNTSPSVFGTKHCRKVGRGHIGAVEIQRGNAGVGVKGQRDVLINIALDQAGRGINLMRNKIRVHQVRVKTAVAVTISVFAGRANW